MKVLILGNQPEPIRSIITGEGHEAQAWSGHLDVQFLEERGIEFIVSYGYRHLIRRPVLEYLPGRIINLHISYLPWNRGADPNLWSFLEDTPKGVSIHFVDSGIDTGDIVARQEVSLGNDEAETLATTYQRLHDEMIRLFRDHWTRIQGGDCPGRAQAPGGSAHRSSDKGPYARLLVKGWDTPVHLLKGAALAGTAGCGKN